MKKIFLLSNVFIFVLGSALLLGSYFIFNQYSLSGSNDFKEGAAGQTEGTWIFPERPVELSEGDTIAIVIAMNMARKVTLYIDSASGNQIYTETRTGDFIVYCYIPANNLYYFVIALWYPTSGQDAALHVNYSIDISGKEPNQLFMITGIILLLAGVVTTPIAFLHKGSNGKNQ